MLEALVSDESQQRRPTIERGRFRPAKQSTCFTALHDRPSSIAQVSIQTTRAPAHVAKHKQLNIGGAAIVANAEASRSALGWIPCSRVTSPARLRATNNRGGLALMAR